VAQILVILKHARTSAAEKFPLRLSRHFFESLGSVEQRTSRRNRIPVMQHCSRERVSVHVDFFCARRLHRAVSNAAMEIVEISSPASCRGCTGDQFSSPHCRLSKATSNLVFPQPNGAHVPMTAWRILHGHGEFSASSITIAPNGNFAAFVFPWLPLFFCCGCLRFFFSPLFFCVNCQLLSLSPLFFLRCLCFLILHSAFDLVSRLCFFGPQILPLFFWLCSKLDSRSCLCFFSPLCLCVNVTETKASRLCFVFLPLLFLPLFFYLCFLNAHYQRLCVGVKSCLCF
jgi:hypothetical protein